MILDTLKVKDTNGSHGTHCASIAAGSIFNKLHALHALKHFAEKQGKPLVVSWSANSHLGFHDGTSTMARYIGAFCNPASQVPESTEKGSVLALCSSNEGEETMYIERNISKGGSQKVKSEQTVATTNTAHFFIKTGKEIKVDLAIMDRNNKIVHTVPLQLSSKAQDFRSTFTVSATINPITNKITYDNNNDYYDNYCVELLSYFAEGRFTISIWEGIGLDNNLQQYPYVEIVMDGGPTYWRTEQDRSQAFFPVLVISSPDEDVKIQGWAEYINLSATSMERPNVLTPGTSDHSMGDWCTSGEAVVVGAYVTDRRSFYRDDLTKEVKLEENEDETIGKYASFSSYGYDFSEARNAYPDVSAPGRYIYAAANSFADEDQLVTAEYAGQFEGQAEPRSYPYATKSGTSMSTPAAAGIIALWMQAAKDKNKTVDNKYIKEIIKATSDTDDFTRAEPLRYGAGKINAYKGLLYVLDLYDPAGINTISTHQPDHVTFRLEGHKLYAEGAEEGTPVSLYNLHGVLVGQTAVQGGAIMLNGLSKGVYAVQLGKLGSTLVRL